MVLILCITPTLSQLRLSLSTLRFGTQAKKISIPIVGSTFSNQQDSTKSLLEEYMKRVKELESSRENDKKQICELQKKVQFLENENLMMKSGIKKFSRSKDESELLSLLRDDISSFSIGQSYIESTKTSNKKTPQLKQFEVPRSTIIRPSYRDESPKKLLEPQNLLNNPNFLSLLSYYRKQKIICKFEREKNKLLETNFHSVLNFLANPFSEFQFTEIFYSGVPEIDILLDQLNSILSKSEDEFCLNLDKESQESIRNEYFLKGIQTSIQSSPPSARIKELSPVKEETTFIEVLTPEKKFEALKKSPKIQNVKSKGIQPQGKNRSPDLKLKNNPVLSPFQRKIKVFTTLRESSNPKQNEKKNLVRENVKSKIRSRKVTESLDFDAKIDSSSKSFLSNSAISSLGFFSNFSGPKRH